MAQVSEEREDRVDATGEPPAARPGTPEPAGAGAPAAPEIPGTGRTAETPAAPENPARGEASATSEAGKAAETPAGPASSAAASAGGAVAETPAASANGVSAVSANGAAAEASAASESGAAAASAGDAAAEAQAPSANGATAGASAAAEGAAETGTPEAKKASKAGRNLPAAIGVALLLGAAVIVSLVTVRYLFIGIIAIAMAVGTFEFAGVLRRVAGTRVAMIPVLVGGQAMIWLAWPFGREGALTAFVLTVLACLLWRLPGGAKGYLRDISASVFAAAYLPLFGAFAAMLVPPSDGVGRVLTFLIGVVASDTGGYIAGVLGGKHPMAPTISPKKTWEGFAGSVIGGVVAGALTLSLLLDGHVWQGAIFGVAIVLTATLGDLVESLIKRDLGVKDMGTLLPGHGGLMDRLDSLLPSAVVSWLLLSAFVPVG
ncbi:phosphatidate cytidylyltransferase [Amycolatopsis sp. NPDC026612]|uniref:phosphatidate cytidylyltransferase n=1 Tax=Amycolatopsis sp. NPDC026612 TaxID=3155466 RepID=UPI0033E60E68